MRQLDLHLVPFVFVAGLEGRVAEPDGAVALDHDVVGRVEALALEVVGQHGDAAVVLGPGDAPAQALVGRAFAGDQAALVVAGQAVGVVRGCAIDAQGLADLVPAHDAVVGNVTDQQVAAIAHPYRAFGPAQAGGDLFHAGIEQAQVEEAVVEDLDRRIGIARVQRFPRTGQLRQERAHAGGSDRVGEGLLEKVAARAVRALFVIHRQGPCCSC